ncbi:MAG: hypothetical protein M3R25_06990 [Bacteroidota bacterium]|nr:hypothetical protein [Bacteroidota bacterium]
MNTFSKKQIFDDLASEFDKKEDVVGLKVMSKKADHNERLQYFIEHGSGNTGKIDKDGKKLGGI